MAIAYETSLAPATVSFPSGGGSQTVSFNAGSGANRVLLVAVTYRERTANITGVTYNGVSMTSAGTEASGGDETCACSLWYLAGPASGANDIVATMSSSGSGDATGQISAWVANGVDQATPVGGYNSGTGIGSSASIVSSVTITSETNDVVVVCHGTYNTTENISATASAYTERQDAANSAGIATSFGDASGAATVATTATWSNGAYTVSWAAVGVTINPAPVGTPLRRPLVLRPMPFDPGLAR